MERGQFVYLVKVYDRDGRLLPMVTAFATREGAEEYVHTFLKVAFTEKTDRAQYANAKGYSAPRFSSVIPDLIKFTAGKMLVGVNPASAIDLLNVTAKPLRYLFRNDVHVIPQSAFDADKTKKGDALDEAVSLAHIFISE